MYKQQPLLIVEDSNEDFSTLLRVLRKLSFDRPIQRVESGDEALDFLFRQGEYIDAKKSPQPSLVLLDLNLPGTDGREVLFQIKSDETLRMIPIVVFTTSSNPKDIEVCYRFGVNSYMLKPMDTQALYHTVQAFLVHWYEVVVLPESLLDL